MKKKNVQTLHNKLLSLSLILLKKYKSIYVYVYGYNWVNRHEEDDPRDDPFFRSFSLYMEYKQPISKRKKAAQLFFPWPFFFFLCLQARSIFVSPRAPKAQIKRFIDLNPR